MTLDSIISHYHIFIQKLKEELHLKTKMINQSIIRIIVVWQIDNQSITNLILNLLNLF